MTVTVELNSNPVSVNFGNLDTVSGASALTTANRLVKVSGSGGVTMASVSESAGALTGVVSARASTSAGLAVQSNNGTLVATFGPGGGAGVAFADGVTCSSLTATSASGITTIQSSTQDGIQLLGRAGGTSSYVGTLTPTTLTASRTWTFPDAAITVAGSASALTSGRVPYVTTGGLLTDSAGMTYNGTSLTLTGALTVPNGTAAAPGIRLTSEASGLYRVSATSLGFSVAGTAAASIDSAGLFTATSASFGGNISLTGGNRSINAGTSDGSDTRFLSLAGGGAALSTRGAFVNAIGNEFATTSFQGCFEFVAGFDAGFADANAGSIRFSTSSAERMRIWRSGGLELGTITADPGVGCMAIRGTTASTSTTTGALVVSGGVGVAGRVNAGANIDSIQSTNGIAQISAETTSTGASAYAQVRARNSAGINSYFGVVGSGAGGFGGVAASEAYMGCNNTTLHIITNDTSRISVTSAGVVSVSNTTASTSTTTGSLVTAGGFAAAKEVVTGLGLWLVDGQTAPGATTGYAKIYVDTADGDLKIIFGDGTIKTIVTDT